jgi:hypothetical protein
MSYTVEVSLKGTTPANTQTIYTKTGTFGQDGTAIYKGYRTIDFDKYVYLPKGQNYFVTVTLTGKSGETYTVPMSDPLMGPYDYPTVLLLCMIPRPVLGQMYMTCCVAYLQDNYN